ncbi:hypothetical protein H696_02652 [Fonticula alba]|uniref:Histidine kinase/HSP90-like ATPase domain-containing protein n=1 Tax=Fonticula alba TaxID=691883 RepID=A0A058Z8R5_FONAL|nr:hypothetical protein H696_02652 [Fonticula alba]KCV70323.1 hypothetical protein H696_02652 [Fonticula alba]|eukprot:XP_009494839.1 hypothetical protein H696_02652 [Fonticula alba]
MLGRTLPMARFASARAAAGRAVALRASAIHSPAALAADADRRQNHTAQAAPLVASRFPLARAFSTEATPAAETAKPASTVRRQFQAETAKLLDIVANSLYSEKEVFVREIISNASDALEKLRHMQLTDASLGGEGPLSIAITTDEEANTITFTDNGIGMTEEEMINNLGTIARSGSKAFIEDLKKTGGSANASDSIIGQFGVGFYSTFMVGNQVEVISRSVTDPNGKGYGWISSGTGEYEMYDAPDAQPGTKIIIHLKDSCREFSRPKRISDVIDKYSSFISFPIMLNNAQINNLKPLWMHSKEEITPEALKNFYRFTSGMSDDPIMSLHYSADAPLTLRTLLFVPSHNVQRFQKRIDHTVSLYTRKVLIQANCRHLLPEWLRFVTGVVDSEDIPLNLSREMLQDSALIAKIRRHLTGRILRWFSDEARNNPDSYLEFYEQFGIFLKEGAATDREFTDRVMKLLRFNSSYCMERYRERAASYERRRQKHEDETGNMLLDEEFTAAPVASLDEYIARMKPGQNKIYYLVTPTRQLAEQSVYYEPFKQHGLEVLFLHEAVDEYVMNNLRSYEGKEFVNIESPDVDIKATVSEEEAKEAEKNVLDSDAVCFWFLQTLGNELVQSVNVSNRLVSYPAMIVGSESGAMRSMMQMLHNSMGEDLPIPPQRLEINPNHPIVRNIIKLRDSGNTAIARMAARQMFDNARMAAGVIDDPRAILPNLNRVLEFAILGAADSKSNADRLTALLEKTEFADNYRDPNNQFSELDNSYSEWVTQTSNESVNNVEKKDN